MAITAGILLTLYLVGILFALLAPTRQHDPQRGVAVGCLMIVAGAILVLGLALGLGVFFDWPWMINIIFWITIFPFISLFLATTRQLVLYVRRKMDR
jgi:hypothetical protein